MKLITILPFILFIINSTILISLILLESRYTSYSFFIFLVTAYPGYKSLVSLHKKQLVNGYLFIGSFISLLVFTSVQLYPFLSEMEEEFINLRFKLLRGKIGKTVVSIDQGYIEKFDPPANARRDIQIIGIKTETLEKLNGDWPINWNEYSKIINLFKSTNNTLFFDIFFLDEKKDEADILSSAIQGTNNVIVDYSIESNSASKSALEYYSEKIEVLNKFKLISVIDEDGFENIWLDFPVPPILRVSKFVSSLGFANIKKDGDLPVRKMPLVAKVIHNGTIDYYPSADLVIVCKYLNVDVVKNTEIKMGEYIKIKDIPKKTILTKDRTETDILTSPNENREIYIPIDHYGQMEINFVGSLFSYKDEDLYEVANDWTREYASNYENTIFLIGMYYATGLSTAKDTYISPYGEMSGIEHHAHTLNTILNQDFLVHPSKIIEFLIFLFSGVLITLNLYKFSNKYSILFLILYTLFFILLNFTFFLYSIIIPLSNVLLSNVLIFISINAFKVFSEEENTRYIRNTFSKFVSKDIVNELLKNPDNIALGGAKKEITIFFSDIRGFTTLSEELSPEELVSILNEYLSVMTDSLLEYKGTIDKYMGDSIMAFWGAPIELEDHAYFACVAALVQIKKLKTLQNSWEKRQLPSIEIGIGLNTGFAVVGIMGSSMRMEYTCIGDTINIASRLEGLNKNYGTKIIISEFTYEKVKDKVYARELDLVKVKGKNLPVRIYELLDLRDKVDYKTHKEALK